MCLHVLRACVCFYGFVKLLLSRRRIVLDPNGFAWIRMDPRGFAWIWHGFGMDLTRFPIGSQNWPLQVADPQELHKAVRSEFLSRPLDSQATFMDIVATCSRACDQGACPHGCAGGLHQIKLSLFRSTNIFQRVQALKRSR